MYYPKHFVVDDPDLLTQIMREYSFATIVTNGDEEPHATHIPVLYDPERNTIRGHVAKVNPHGTALASRPTVVIFNGPSCYVSARWYTAEHDLPTWNYVAVHAHGRPRVLDREESAQMLLDLIAFHDPELTRIGLNPAQQGYMSKLLSGITAFEMPIDRLEGKFKLNQNKTEQDRRNVIAELSQSPDPFAQRVAALMRV